MKKTTYINLHFADLELSTADYANVSYMDKFFYNYDKKHFLFSKNLKNILEEQTKVKNIVFSDPNNEDKRMEEKKIYFGETGAIFPVMTYNIHGSEYSRTVFEKGGGKLLFIDIDGVDKAEAKNVFDNADLLKKRIPSLVAINYSISKNLHIFSFGTWQNREQYKVKQKWVSNLIIDEVNNIFGYSWSKGKETNDSQQSLSTQRFPTCHTADYKWWDIADNILGEIVEEETDEQEPDVKFTEPFTGTFTTSNNHNKLKIDKNFKVGNYSGNDLRWRIANIVLWYCKGDRSKAEEWIKDHFTNYKEINFGPDAYAINPLVKKWFDDEFSVFAITTKSKIKAIDNADGIVVEPSKTLSDYRHIVEESIEKYNSTLLVADTGLGKTTLFNKIAMERKCIILVPFNCQLDLYNGFNVVKSGSDYYIDETRTNVMIWDQLVARTNEYILNTKFKDFTIVIDECHQLWGDRNYRESAVDTVELLKSFNGKKLFMTATSIMEETLFTIDNKLKFRRNRKHIDLKWITTNDDIKLIKKLVKKNKKDYDNILVFSDMYAKRLWLDDMDNEFESTLIHAGMLDDPMNTNALKVLDTTKELLIDKVTYATKFAYSGKNFRNRGKMLVIVHANYDTDAQYIIQAVGRPRMTDVLDAVVVQNTTEHDYEAGIRSEKVQDDLVKNAGNDEIANLMIAKDEEGVHSKKNIDVMKQLNEYYAKASERDFIIQCLVNTGYIDVTLEELEISDERREDNKLKRKHSDWLISYIYDNMKLPKTDENTICYVKEWVIELYRINKTIGNMKLIIDYISERGLKDCVMMDTIINDLHTMVKCSTLSEDTRTALSVEDEKEYRKWVNSMIEKFDDTITKNKYRDMCKKLRNILLKINIKGKNVPVDELLVDIFNISTSDAFEQRIEYSMKKNDSKKEKITLKWIGGWTYPDIDGIQEKQGVLEFESKSDAIRVIGTNKMTFNRFLNGDKTKLADLWEIV